MTCIYDMIANKFDCKMKIFILEKKGIRNQKVRK